MKCKFPVDIRHIEKLFKSSTHSLNGLPLQYDNDINNNCFK